MSTGATRVYADKGTNDTLTAVKFWQSTRTLPDWRFAVVGGNCTSSNLTNQGGGMYVANVAPPKGNDDGGTAFFIELTYHLDGMDLVFTTDISIVDSVAPT